MQQRARLIDILKMATKESSDETGIVMRKYLPHVKGYKKKNFAFEELMPFLDGGENDEIDHNIQIREVTDDYIEVGIDKEACKYIEKQIMKLLGTTNI